MSESTIRQAIYTVLNGVADIGKVYDYGRFIKDWGRYIKLFATTVGGVKQIRGWEIQRQSAPEDRNPARGHTYIIRGFLGLKDSDATEKTFNDLIEAVAAAFRADQFLGGTVLGHDYIQVERIETRIFGDVFCHYTELKLTVYEDKYQ